MTHLTAIVLTHNEEAHIKACLRALEFADERLVFDSYSTDNTVELARATGARAIRHAFESYAAQRNAALNAVKDSADWVLFVDADERVTSPLAEEILKVLVHPECEAYRIPRHNYLFGRLTKGAGWYPDYQTRLLQVGRTRYEGAVHEVVQVDGCEGTLSEHLVHYNYEDIAHFIEKQQRYVLYDAQILYREGVQPKPWTYITQPLRHFKWRFFDLNGYREGWHGLRLSLLMAWYEFRKYWLLRHLHQTNASDT